MFTVTQRCLAIVTLIFGVHLHALELSNAVATMLQSHPDILQVIQQPEITPESTEAVTPNELYIDMSDMITVAVETEIHVSNS